MINYEQEIKGKLYLIPSSLGGDDIGAIWPPGNKQIVNSLNEFIVENIRSARRFLRAAGYNTNFEEVTFHQLNKHTPASVIGGFLSNAASGKNLGLLSEAGCPCIADPGQSVVALAHKQHISVIPLVGASSILLALMASGFNGQQFVFHGYLPIEKSERSKKIRTIEHSAIRDNQTQIFMETPYRNNQLMKELSNNLKDSTLLCVACDLTLPTQFIKTQIVGNWKKKMPDLHKRTSIFLIYTE